MHELNMFSLRSHEGPQKSWGIESELLLNGSATDKFITGYVLEAHYRCNAGHIFVTSWDCGEDSLDIILANEELNVLDRKTVGATYDLTYLVSHEILAENQILLRCDNDFLVRVTVDNGLILHQKYGDLKDFIPYPNSTVSVDKSKKHPWWRIW